MESEAVGTETDARIGIEPSGWVGGLVGGLVGAAVFGLLMWFASPEFLRSSIPALYGIEPAGTIGWVLHLIHGALLGLVFAVVVTRDRVAATLTADVETKALDSTGTGSRLAAAGLAYGIAVWAILPMIVMPAWLGAVGYEGPPVGPTAIALESLAGHVVFGLLLGLVYAAVVGRT